MITLIILLLLQPSPQEICESARGYFRVSDQVCLKQADMDEDQPLLLVALRRAEDLLVAGIGDQERFNDANVAIQNAAFGQRIAALNVKRGQATGRPRQVYQDEIDRIVVARARLNSTAPGSERERASRLGPVILQLQQDIAELKQDLDSSFT